MQQEEIIQFDATRAITSHLKNATVVGDVTAPKNARALIIFAHSSGSSKHSSCNGSDSHVTK